MTAALASSSLMPGVFVLPAELSCMLSILMRPISSTFTAFNKRVVPLIGGVASLLLMIGGVVGAIKSNQPAFFFFPLLLTTVWLVVWWSLIRPLVDGVWLDEPVDAVLIGKLAGSH